MGIHCKNVHGFSVVLDKYRSDTTYLVAMYRTNLQPELPDFYLPFGGKLDPDNRWVKLARIIPWHLVEKDYRTNVSVLRSASCHKCRRLGSYDVYDYAVFLA